MTDVAACPRCARTLRLVTPPTQPHVLTHCPSCGAPLLIASGDSLLLIDEKDASSWRFRQILRDQGVELGGAAGSALGGGALTAFAFGATGHILAAIGTVVLAAVTGAGMSTSIAIDARAGAAMWHRALTREEDLLVVQPDGYRA